MDTADQPAAPTFLAALQELHHQAGQPGMRTLARDSRGGFSHTTVHDALRGRVYPTWRIAVSIIKTLGGNPAAYRALWDADRPAWRRIEPTDPRTPSGITAQLIKAVEANTAAVEQLVRTVERLAPAPLPPPPEPPDRTSYS